MTHYFSRQPLPDAAIDVPSDGGRNRLKSGLLRALGTDVRWATFEVGGCSLELASSRGVFSRSELDAGSRLLLETVAIKPQTSICDLGCGWGPIGCFVAAQQSDCRVWMCDINLRAVALARFNAAHNGLANATTWCGDALDAARGDMFDTILCNPPVRAGNEVIARLFAGAQRCLRTDAELWVVLRTAQGARSWQRRLDDQFGNCDTVKIAHGYRILKSAQAE